MRIIPALLCVLRVSLGRCGTDSFSHASRCAERGTRRRARPYPDAEGCEPGYIYIHG